MADTKMTMFDGIRAEIVDHRTFMHGFSPAEGVVYDIFVCLGDLASEHVLELGSLAHRVAEVPSDWVEVFGRHSELFHDMVDHASVQIGRQGAVGDGAPMTAWYENDVTLEQMASACVDNLAGAMDHRLVVVATGREDVAALAEAMRRYLVTKENER